MPSEKYSPLLLVLRVYLWPVSTPIHATSAWAIGFPSRSLQIPFTVPMLCANESGTDDPAARTSSRGRMKYFFMIWPPGIASELKTVDESGSNSIGRRVPRTEWDLPRPLHETRACEAHSCRRLRRRDLRADSMTTLNRMGPSVQGPASQSRLCAWQSAVSPPGLFRLLCPPSRLR